MEELAEASGVSARAISDLELGHSRRPAAPDDESDHRCPRARSRRRARAAERGGGHTSRSPFRERQGTASCDVTSLTSPAGRRPGPAAGPGAPAQRGQARGHRRGDGPRWAGQDGTVLATHAARLLRRRFSLTASSSWTCRGSAPASHLTRQKAWRGCSRHSASPNVRFPRERPSARNSTGARSADAGASSCSTMRRMSFRSARCCRPGAPAWW